MADRSATTVPLLEIATFRCPRESLGHCDIHRAERARSSRSRAFGHSCHRMRRMTPRLSHAVVVALLALSCSRSPPPQPQPHESEVIQTPKSIDAAAAKPQYRTTNSAPRINPAFV